MFPLRKRIVIRGCQAHINAGLGCATDYKTQGIWIGDLPFWSKKKLRAPFSGSVLALPDDYDPRGGKWLRLTRSNGDKIEFSHLDRRFVGNRIKTVKQGQLMAYTGNTGTLTTGAHLHLQVKNRAGLRLNPENYRW